MRTFSFLLIVVLAALGAAGPAAARRAAASPDPARQAKAIAVLKSNASRAEKAQACRELKYVGSAEAVGALARLLTNKELSHMARYALESMPCRQAGAALRAALPKSSGLIQVGIINSLGERRDAEAAAPLAKLARSEDTAIAAAAAAALGKIAAPAAARALIAARAKAPKPLQREFVEAVLRCASRRLAAGDRKDAEALYRDLQKAGEPPFVRRAGFRGLVGLGDATALRTLGDALAGDDPDLRAEALQLARAAPGARVTRSLAALLPKLAPAKQVGVLAVLADRGDAAAAPAVLTAARSADASVRAAALEALATVGDASAVPILVEAAAGAAGDERRAARRALARLPGKAADEAVLAQLDKAAPAVAAEAARALAARRVASAVPALLKLATAGRQAARTAALEAIGRLGDGKAVAPLVRVLTQARTNADRQAAEGALVAVCGRAENKDACIAPVAAGAKQGAAAARAALLRVCGRVGGAEALGALRAGVRDADAVVRDAAIRAMAGFPDLAAAPDLLALAKAAPGLPHRVLALRGYLRLVGQAGDQPAEKRWRMCKAAMSAASRPEDKKLVLAQLAKVPHPGALQLAETCLAQKPLAAEAETAYLQIALGLSAAHPDRAKAALKKIVETWKNADARKAAAEGLKALRKYEGYVANWLVAGPYRQEGKQCRQLFDIAFPPERSGAAEATWKPAPHPADSSLAWQVDLGGIVGGDHCVVYIRTRVYSPKKQPVRLEIGTDDGIKLWINGKLVHSNNAVRGLRAAEDKAAATLEKGWNRFLAKITQHTLGCGACIRLVTAEGEPVEGLRCDPGGSGTRPQR